jgi:small subunit ribosomal protein S6
VREYEVTIVIKTSLDDDARNAIVEQVGGWLNPGGDEATAPKVNHWGQRSLAYPIEKERDGYYVLYEATIEPEQIKAVERQIMYEEGILRHLVVRKGE